MSWGITRARTASKSRSSGRSTLRLKLSAMSRCGDRVANEFCSEFDSTTAPPGSIVISRPNCAATARPLDFAKITNRKLSLPSDTSCDVRRTTDGVPSDLTTPRLGSTIPTELLRGRSTSGSLSSPTICRRRVSSHVARRWPLSDENRTIRTASPTKRFPDIIPPRASITSVPVAPRLKEPRSNTVP